MKAIISVFVGISPWLCVFCFHHAVSSSELFSYTPDDIYPHRYIVTLHYMDRKADICEVREKVPRPHVYFFPLLNKTKKEVVGKHISVGERRENNPSSCQRI